MDVIRSPGTPLDRGGPDAAAEFPGTDQARILELSAATGQLLRVLHTQVLRVQYTQTAGSSGAGGEQEAPGTCAVPSVDPSGDHVLVQAFSFGRIDNGFFTALPGGSPGGLGAAAAW
jgi:hypothetical protein